MSIEVFVQHQNASGIDHALKILRRKLSREGVFPTLEHHAHYLKPSEELKLKRRRSESRRRKARARWAAKNKAQVTER